MDVDVHESVIEKPPTFEHDTEKRAKALLGARKTIRGMLSKPEHAGAFKLKTLADAFFEPLEQQLEKTYLLGDDLSAVDFLALGYLQLMLRPELPQNWLQREMKRYPKLVAYTERMEELGVKNKGIQREWATQEAMSFIGTALSPDLSRPALVAGGLSTLLGCLVYTQVALPRGDEMHIFGRRRLADLGAVGAALADMSL